MVNLGESSQADGISLKEANSATLFHWVVDSDTILTKVANSATFLNWEVDSGTLLLYNEQPVLLHF